MHHFPFSASGVVMKTDRTLLALCVLCALSFLLPRVGAGQGFGPGGDGRYVERTLDTLKVRLALTDDQAGKVKTILTDYRARLTAAREVAAGDRTVMMDSLRVATDAMDKSIEAILTDTQKPAFTKYLADRQARMMQRRQRPEGPPPPTPR
jgi:Spy/CpxP family protein refolding chaperone